MALWRRRQKFRAADHNLHFANARSVKMLGRSALRCSALWLCQNLISTIMMSFLSNDLIKWVGMSVRPNMSVFCIYSLITALTILKLHKMILDIVSQNYSVSLPSSAHPLHDSHRLRNGCCVRPALLLWGGLASSIPSTFQPLGCTIRQWEIIDVGASLIWSINDHLTTGWISASTQETQNYSYKCQYSVEKIG